MESDAAAEAARILGTISAAKRTPEERAEYGGRGGRARAAALSAARRRAIAKKAAAARWAKKH